jgi:hypothetical protein
MRSIRLILSGICFLTHFVQLTTPTLPSVSTSLSCRVFNTSRPALTPKIPSYRPPVGCVSRCEPIITGGADVFFPGRIAKRLPIWSIEVLQLSDLAVDKNQFRMSLSASFRLRRAIPVSVGCLEEIPSASEGQSTGDPRTLHIDGLLRICSPRESSPSVGSG